MVKVEQHEITFIIFSVIALLFLGAILYVICCVHITRHDLRATEERLTNGHNKLAVRLQELEQAQKKLRRTAINNFRLTCKTGEWDEKTQKWKSAGKDNMDDVSSDGIKGVYVRFRPCTQLREQMKGASFFDVSKTVFGKKWADNTPNP